jgi:hypothetical protein
MTRSKDAHWVALDWAAETKFPLPGNIDAPHHIKCSLNHIKLSLNHIKSSLNHIKCSLNRQTVEELARSVMSAPVRVTVGERNTASASVSQRLLFVGQVCDFI